MKIFIQFRERHIELEVDPNDTILDIKNKIARKENILPLNQTLIFAGKKCPNHAQCSEYSNFQNGTIYLVITEASVHQNSLGDVPNKEKVFENYTSYTSDLSNKKLFHEAFTLVKFLELFALFLLFLLSAFAVLATGFFIGWLFGVWPDIHTFFEAIHLITDWGIGVAIASGVLALGITNMVGWKAYGNVSLNAFSGIIETTASPHARTLRTGYWGKVEDACRVFFGNSDHFGLLDGATLFLAGSLEKLTKKALTHPNPIIKVLGVALLIVTIPLWIARLLLTAVLVFNPVSLLIIGVVHLVSEYLAGGAQLKKQVVDQVKTFVDAELRKNSAEKNSSDRYAHNFLNYTDEETQQAIDSLTISPHIENELILGKKIDNDANYIMTFYKPSIFVGSNPNIQTLQTFEKALLTLNCGDLTRKLENGDETLPQKPLLNLLSKA